LSDTDLREIPMDSSVKSAQIGEICGYVVLGSGRRTRTFPPVHLTWPAARAKIAAVNQGESGWLGVPKVVDR